MRRILLLTSLFLFLKASAQHCPWDCTGFLMLKTDATEAEMQMLRPVLVDADKQVVIDTLYGTGKDTYDSCIFLEYRDFVKYRTARIKVYYWYQYDTVLKFAKDYYVVHYNFCKNSGKPLFIRYTGPGHGHYHYIEIPDEKRIHLHELNAMILAKDYEGILKKVEPNIISVNRSQWGL
jgi:hypothetical protein